jgi:hypothetical protein
VPRVLRRSVPFRCVRKQLRIRPRVAVGLPCFVRPRSYRRFFRYNAQTASKHASLLTLALSVTRLWRSAQGCAAHWARCTLALRSGRWKEIRPCLVHWRIPAGTPRQTYIVVCFERTAVCASSVRSSELRCPALPQSTREGAWGSEWTLSTDCAVIVLSLCHFAQTSFLIIQSADASRAHSTPRRHLVAGTRATGNSPTNRRRQRCDWTEMHSCGTVSRHRRSGQPRFGQLLRAVRDGATRAVGRTLLSALR